jgi:hypothetical protein
MTTVVYCDHCGATPCRAAPVEVTFHIAGGDADSEFHDLCGPCFDQLQRWLNEGVQVAA